MRRRQFLEAAAAASGLLLAPGCGPPTRPPAAVTRGRGGAVKRILFVSDTHIGMDAPTNWYQSAVHERLLLAVLDHVAANADSIAELVLLGDIVDQWTYLPSVRPPSFADIAAANPRVFAPGTGALARVIEALDGNVTYLLGNHDMQISGPELAAVRDRTGRTLRLSRDFPYLPEAGLGQVACAHGHQFSIFNANDPASMLPGDLPVGHFVTRLAALWSMERLSPGETVADQPGSGEPTGWAWEKDELETAVADVFAGKDSLARLVTDALVRATHIETRLPITIFDGTQVTVGDVSNRLYPNLYHGFKDANLYPGSAYGAVAAFHALVSTDLHNDLTHFARELGAHHRVVVFGHTHSGVDRLQSGFGAPNIYANCGFGAPSVPDMAREHGPERATFVEVEVDEAERKLTALLRSVVPGPAGAQVADVPLRAELIEW